jgi:hypothetical protein
MKGTWFGRGVIWVDPEALEAKKLVIEQFDRAEKKVLLVKLLKNAIAPQAYKDPYPSLSRDSKKILIRWLTTKLAGQGVTEEDLEAVEREIFSE